MEKQRVFWPPLSQGRRQMGAADSGSQRWTRGPDTPLIALRGAAKKSFLRQPSRHRQARPPVQLLAQFGGSREIKGGLSRSGGRETGNLPRCPSAAPSLDLFAGESSEQAAYGYNNTLYCCYSDDADEDVQNVSKVLDVSCRCSSAQGLHVNVEEAKRKVVGRGFCRSHSQCNRLFTASRPKGAPQCDVVTVV